MVAAEAEAEAEEAEVISATKSIQMLVLDDLSLIRNS